MTEDHTLDASEESGTAPADRKFRPDVEGLRAVAVLLVVLYHAHVLRVTGGYVGVDVFFVISGFVITGLLLRENESTGRTSIVNFYARRVRRILPAATFVILVTVLFSYFYLGVVANSVADDGRWAAVFLSNFHFESVGTNYLSSHLAPSPLQNFWSLSVEEQFYVVFPTFFLILSKGKGQGSTRTKLTIALIGVIVLSYGLSIVQTTSSPTAAYFSPFTRGWEIALGALIAVSTATLRRIPVRMAVALTCIGLAAILYSAFAFNAWTVYPGSAVAVPVVGAGLIIAGGVAARGRGVEWALGRGPFQWLGRHSYSWYLVHWPILIIATEGQGKFVLPGWENALWVTFALGIAVLLYRFLENPIRHVRVPSPATVIAGGVVVAATVLLLTAVIFLKTSGAPSYPVVPAVNQAAVVSAVAAAPAITKIPTAVEPSVSDAGSDWGGSFISKSCISGVEASTSSICNLGDVSSSKLMVALGDSHVLMWIPALDAEAKKAHLRLVVLSHWYCPSTVVTIINPPGFGLAGGPFTACNRWRKWAIHWVNVNRPSVLLVSNEDLYRAPVAGRQGRLFTPSAWRTGMIDLFDQVTVPGIRKIVLGNIPVLPEVGPICLSKHADDVQACSGSAAVATTSFAPYERQAAAVVGAQYIDPTSWFCSASCTAIVKHYIVYMDQFHITATYGRYLENVLGNALKL